MLTNSKSKSNQLIHESLDFIFESVELAILIENPKRQIEFVNPLFCNLFHLKSTPEQLTNSNILASARGFSLQFEKSTQFENSLIEIPEQGELVKAEYWKLRNGKTVVRDYIPIFNGNELKGHVWVYKEQKINNTGSKVENTNALIENALHNIPGEIAIYNPNCEIIFTNKAYINSLEKRVWAKGKTLTQYFSYANLSPETAVYRVDNIKKVIENKKAIIWEEISISPNQKNQDFLRTCYPVFDENRNVESVIEQSIDISHQKKLESKLKLATEDFFNTLDSVNDIIIHTDAELKLKFVNKAWESFTGQLFENYKSKPIFDILSITRYELYAKAFELLAGISKDKSGIVNMPGKDGEEKTLKYNLQRSFNVEDDKYGILATLTDITHHQEQEKQLLELVKREKELNELKTAFVNMVSHELRTPLTVISSSAEILDLLLQAGKSHDEVSVYTKQILDEVEKMTSFMQDLLMISKIEAGKIIINTSNIDVIKFTEEIVSNGFSPWKDGRSSEIIIKRKPREASIDQKMLGHALHNLLQNAFKYSSGKSSPKLRVAFSNTYFTISVIDEGIGIPQKDLEKLFSSFFRATNTGNISGTGIGLIVTKYFTEQHKGYVAVKSRINKGSIFTIKLPYHSNE